jgi:serine-type D-Ala-D-Ala endopeptidase (penicillin-binding protein 7)
MKSEAKKQNVMKRNAIMLFATLSFLAPSLTTSAADHSTQHDVYNSSAKKRVTHTIPARSTSTVQQINDNDHVNNVYVNNAYDNSYGNGDNNISYENHHYQGDGLLQLASSKALIINQETGEILYAKNTNTPTPIASVTKLMTAMVVLDAMLPLDEYITVSEADIDKLKGTGSRLRVGTSLPRSEMLRLALMASENRAASALGRHYPGGLRAFIQAMNHKAYQLGMFNTRFADPTGLNSKNISTAEDLVKLVAAAYEYPEIRQESTTVSQEVSVRGARNPMSFVNTNALVRKGDWVIGLSKTGFISEAGRCLVMQAEIGGQPLIIVLLDSAGKMTRIGDANRIRKWIESNNVNARMG